MLKKKKNTYMVFALLRVVKSFPWQSRRLVKTEGEERCGGPPASLLLWRGPGPRVSAVSSGNFAEKGSGNTVL